MNPDILMLFDKLPNQLVHPRIAESVEPYPELMGWIDESYRFSLSKRRNRRERHS